MKLTDKFTTFFSIQEFLAIFNLVVTTKCCVPKFNKSAFIAHIIVNKNLLIYFGNTPCYQILT